MPSPRSRKVPNIVKVPQLRLSIHQELKNMRTTNNILPESIMARYRPTSRTGSTAVVLWPYEVVQVVVVTATVYPTVAGLALGAIVRSQVPHIRGMFFY